MINLSDAKDLLFLASTVTAAVSLGLLISLRTRMASLLKFKDLIENTLGEGTPQNLLDVFESLSGKVDAMTQRTAALESRTVELTSLSKLCTQKIGVLRYNAFDHMGADLSFSVAVARCT